jgi:hypothetical protein
VTPTQRIAVLEDLLARVRKNRDGARTRSRVVLGGARAQEADAQATEAQATEAQATEAQAIEAQATEALRDEATADVVEDTMPESGEAAIVREPTPPLPEVVQAAVAVAAVEVVEAHDVDIVEAEIGDAGVRAADSAAYARTEPPPLPIEASSAAPSVAQSVAESLTLDPITADPDTHEPVTAEDEAIVTPIHESGPDLLAAEGLPASGDDVEDTGERPIPHAAVEVEAEPITPRRPEIAPLSSTLDSAAAVLGGPARTTTGPDTRRGPPPLPPVPEPPRYPPPPPPSVEVLEVDDRDLELTPIHAEPIHAEVESIPEAPPTPQMSDADLEPVSGDRVTQPPSGIEPGPELPFETPPPSTAARLDAMPQRVVPERPATAHVGEYLGELPQHAPWSFGDVLDASLALEL